MMEIVEKYFPSLSENQYQNFKKLESLYRTWNEKINVISRKDIDQLYLRHVLHSLSIAKYIFLQPGLKVLDIGTGGGFPGIPLAIFFPETRFCLIDSIQKKVRVVEAIAKKLDLQNVDVRYTRAEMIHDKFDLVVCRAVAALTDLITWTRDIINPGNKGQARGLIALKGGDLTDEIDPRYETQIIDIQKYFDESFFHTKKIVHVVFG